MWIHSEIGPSNYHFVVAMFEGALNDNRTMIINGMRGINNIRAQMAIYLYLSTISALKECPDALDSLANNVGMFPGFARDAEWLSRVTKCA